MYIRIEFNDTPYAGNHDEQTLNMYRKILNATNGRDSSICLGAHCCYQVSAFNWRETDTNHEIAFWHLDVDILNKEYGGVLNALNGLLSTFTVIKKIDILPIDPIVKLELSGYIPATETTDKTFNLVGKYKTVKSVGYHDVVPLLRPYLHGVT